MIFLFRFVFGAFVSVFFLLVWPNIVYQIASDPYPFAIAKNILASAIGVASLIIFRTNAFAVITFYSGSSLVCLLYRLIFPTGGVVAYSGELFLRDYIDIAIISEWWEFYSFSFFFICSIIFTMKIVRDSSGSDQSGQNH